MKEKTFYYKPFRDVLANIFGSVIAVIVFFAIKALLHQLQPLSFMTDSDRRSLIMCTPLLKWSCIAVFCFCVISNSFYILRNTYKRLIIKTNEIVYVEGWIIKRTETIAAHQIRSCTKEDGPLQRLCHSMDITITTAGDIPEIYFKNIKDGEDAYEELCKIAKKNEKK